MLRKTLKNSQVLVALAHALRSLEPDYRRFLAWMARAKILDAYFRGHAVKRLQLGSGPTVLEGWLNTDFRPSREGQTYLDATQRFPFPTGTFDYIFNEHLLGEFPFGTGLEVLRECWRVLKPGGKIRVSTPNLDAILALGTKTPSDIQRQYIRWAIDRYLPNVHECEAAFVINYFFRGHSLVFVYTPELLTRALESVGFTSITFHSPGESDEPALKGLERHTKTLGEELNRFESMVAEATKPSH